MSYQYQEKTSVCCAEINRQIVKKNQVESQISVPATPVLVAGDQWAYLHGFLFQKLANPFRSAGLLPLYEVASPGDDGTSFVRNSVRSCWLNNVKI